MVFSLSAMLNGGEGRGEVVPVKRRSTVWAQSRRDFLKIARRFNAGKAGYRPESRRDG
jgi:hypothetical protein